MSFVITRQPRSQDLKKHIDFVHEEVKYNCDHCDHKTACQSNLSKHVKSVHTEVKYSCELCVIYSRVGIVSLRALTMCVITCDISYAMLLHTDHKDNL